MQARNGARVEGVGAGDNTVMRGGYGGGGGSQPFLPTTVYISDENLQMLDGRGLAQSEWRQWVGRTPHALEWQCGEWARTSEAGWSLGKLHALHA